MADLRACGVAALLSDFGNADAYVGIVKGVMLGIAPNIRLIDISHQVRPQQVTQGAYLLSTCMNYMPLGTVFMAVVDPGVGSSRRALAARSDRYFYVGPDNGIFARCWEIDSPNCVVSVEPGRWTLPAVSRTFQGRDVFAPVAAHLAGGAPLEEMGRPCANWLKPNEVTEVGKVRVLHVDVFGNIVLDRRAPIGDFVELDGRRIPVAESYSAVPEGELLAYWGSAGHLEVGVNSGSAAQALQVSVGDCLAFKAR